MRLIDDKLSPIDEDGFIQFEFEGYVYYIGQLDGPPGWFSRQSVDDFYNDRDNWEQVIGWELERNPDKKNFKFLKRY